MYMYMYVEGLRIIQACDSYPEPLSAGCESEALANLQVAETICLTLMGHKTEGSVWRSLSAGPHYQKIVEGS